MNKKLMWGIVLPVVLGIILVSAAILFATIPVTFNVGEALSTETVELDFSGVVGDCYTKTFDVTNDATNPLPVQLTWVETSNPNGVTYTITNIPRVETLSNGPNSINIELCYADDSVVGSVSGNIILSRGEGDITGIAHFTQKNIDTWVPIVEGITADVTYSVTGASFTATGIPEGYTLVYYPNTEGDVFATNVANVIILAEGSNSIDSLPLEIDVGDDYCTNGLNPDAKVCTGAKLWLIPGDETEARAKLSTWSEADTYLFETDLITYTNTA